MALIVQKFGGSSVKDAEHIRNVARIITDTYRANNDVVVVLSAQGDTTDELIEKAHEINESPSRREMDMLLSTGEHGTSHRQGLVRRCARVNRKWYVTQIVPYHSLKSLYACFYSAPS